MLTVVRNTPFLAYKNAAGTEVMATVITEPVEVHLEIGPVTYQPGDYEVITTEGKVVFVQKEQFESLFHSIETEETLAPYKGVSESPNGEIKEGGD